MRHVTSDIYPFTLTAKGSQIFFGGENFYKKIEDKTGFINYGWWKMPMVYSSVKNKQKMCWDKNLMEKTRDTLKRVYGWPEWVNIELVVI